jgi:hypothetical protein
VALTATLKGAAVVAEAALVFLIFMVVRRRHTIESARAAAVAIWLNPATIYDASVLGYLDPLFVLPLAASLICARGRPLLAGALLAAAIATKAQAVMVAPAVVLAVWNGAEVAGASSSRLLWAGAGTTAAATAIVGPIVAAGAWRNMLGALASLLRHDMLSGNACNLWWIVGYVMRACYSLDLGVWRAFTMPTRILQISRVVELGYPNPRAIGTALTLLAFAWALFTARRQRALTMIAAVAAFLVHAYATLSAQVHENHLYAAIPFLAIAATGHRPCQALLALLSVIFALNLNFFYGISDGVGYALPRTVTIVDATVILATIECAALWWHARILRDECSREDERRQVPGPAWLQAPAGQGRWSGSRT